MKIMRHPNYHGKGMTLIELMIAMTIGFFIVGVTFALYFNMRTSFRYQEDFARIQESGRFALERVSRDVRMAGYTGCGSVTDFANVVNGGATSPFMNFSTPIIGYEGGASTFPPELLTAGAIIGPGAPDAIILIGVDTSSELIVQGHNPPSAQINTTQHSIKPGEILLITDCSHAAAFQMTGPTNNNNNASNVVHNTGTGAPGNCTKYLGASCPSAKAYQFKPGASLLKMYSNAYFIAPSSLGNGRRSLWTMSLTGAAGPTALEVMEGVEDMQITYGQDTNGDFAADKFVTADVIGTSLTEWGKIVSIRLSFLLKSTKSDITSKKQTYEYNGSTKTAMDKSLFKTFTETITLRNRSV